MPRLLALLALMLGLPAAAQQPLDVPVPRPEPLLAMDLGGGLSSYIISSHLQTGWAHYLETVPATVLRDGIGSWTACQQISDPAAADRILGTLHDYGIGVFRVEVGWGSTEYRANPADPMRLSGHADAVYRAILRSARAHGFRLIVLLNAHQGMPCAARSGSAVVTLDAPQGTREVILSLPDPDAVRPGYTGLSNLSEYCAAEALIQTLTPEPDATGDTFRATLSKPLPKALVAGSRLELHTLQYRPFGFPGSQEETYAGWGQYASLLARTAAEEGLPDGQVDFEVWNELTFGTRFLDARHYDPDAPGEADQNRMLQEAADAIRAVYPSRAAILNGFSNTTFFFGGFWGSVRPRGITGETYHPYGNQWRAYPETALQGNHLAEAHRNVDGFVPRYATFYPEFKGNHETSHSLISLMQPEMRDLLTSVGHAPAGWKRAMTEDGLFIPEVGAPPEFAAKLQAAPEHYVAKYWLRLYPFYLNKGLYAVCDGSLRDPGDWDQSWETRFARTGDTSLLKALEPLRRLASLTTRAQDIAPERLIALHPQVTQLSGHDLSIFTPEGATILERSAEGRPWDPSTVVPRALTYRDVLCMLPFQLTDDTLLIGLYIQTRNILEDVADAGRYRIAFPGLSAASAGVLAYDPLNAREVPAEVSHEGGALSVSLTLSDYPIFLQLSGVDGERGTGPVLAYP